METLYRSKYIELAFCCGCKLIEMTWLPSNYGLKEESYKQQCLNYLEIARKVQPKKMIVDTSDMLFSIAPELQEWTNRAILTPLLSLGLSKCAIVVSKGYFTKVSIEQTMTDPESIKFTTKYFDSKEEAELWIISL